MMERPVSSREAWGASMRIHLLLALLALSLPALAADSSRSATLWLNAQVTIDADGRISSLEWREERPAGRAVIDHIEPIVRGWEFVPGTVDGVPAATRTRLTVRTSIVEEQGALSVYIAEAATGASSIDMQPPRFPLVALKDRVDAEVVTEIDIAADGTITLVDMRFEGSRGILHRKAFLRAAESAIREWSFRLEEVGGHPVATRMSVPVTFCVQGSSWCARRERAAATRPVAPGEALALESAVSLKSDPRTGI